MKRKLFTVADAVAIGLAAVIAVAVFIYLNGGQKGSEAVVYINNAETMRLPLDESTEKRIATKDGYNVITVSNGTCRVTKADCRDGICKSRGEISQRGESIVCLPHRLIIEVE